MTLRRPQSERYIIKADVEGKKNNKNVTGVVAKKNRDRYKENVLKETSIQGRCGVNV